MMRIMQFTFVFAGLMVIYLAWKLPVQSTAHVGSNFEVIVCLLAISNLMLGLGARRFFGRMASSRVTPAATPLKRWRVGNLLSLAFIYAALLFGFVLRVLGGHAIVYEILLTAAMACLLLWSPGKPPDAEPGDAIAR
jgi:hypothetical protein